MRINKLSRVLCLALAMIMLFGMVPGEAWADGIEEPSTETVLPAETPSSKENNDPKGNNDPEEKIDPKENNDPEDKIDPEKVNDPEEKVDPEGNNDSEEIVPLEENNDPEENGTGTIESAPLEDGSVVSVTGVLPEGTILTASKSAAEKNEDGSCMVRFAITLTDSEGNAVQPADTVAVSLPIPKGFTGDLSVCCLDGAEPELMNGTKDESGKTYTFYTTHFSSYGLVNVPVYEETTLTDTASGVAVSGKLLVGALLRVAAHTTEVRSDGKAYTHFDISLVDETGETVPLDGAVTVSLPFPSRVITEEDMCVRYLGGEEPTELEGEKNMENSSYVFSTESLGSFELECVPEANPNSVTAYITYNSVNAELNEDGSNVLENVGWKDTMNLHVAAEFGSGSNKTIEITLPMGMSFRLSENSIYVVKNTDATLKNKINPDKQTDADKKNLKVLNVDQFNGTITLQFNSTGEDNDAKTVAFDVPICFNYRANMNTGVYESGTSWFYDEIRNPVTVTQSMDGVADNTLTLGKITVKYGEGKTYGDSWTAAYNPEVLAGESTTGDESIWVYPVPDGSLTYPKATAYRYYSITYTAPEHAEFVELASRNRVGNYKGQSPVVTEAGETTAYGYTVPEGMKAYTWTITDAVASPIDLKVNPVFNFPEEFFHDGDQATIAVADLHVRYYGRVYEESVEEVFNPASYPSITYDIRSEYEEVFAYKYLDNDYAKTGVRRTDWENGDYTLYLGAPGFEHTQERLAGYYYIGNRGLKDSAPKTITFEFDVNNTGAIGVTEIEIPSLTKKEPYEVSNIQYKTWDSSTNTESEWQTYTIPTLKAQDNSTINLMDLGVKGGSGVYIKAIRLDISTIPKQAYLKNGLSSYTYEKDIRYQFYCNVLTDDAIAAKSKEINNIMTIANKDGDVPEATDTSGRSVRGQAYVGTRGMSYLLGNATSHEIPRTNDNTMQVGTGTYNVCSYVHFYQGENNAQLMDKIYLISPFGEDYTNITMHYEPPAEKNVSILTRKRDIQNYPQPQPEILEISNDDIPAGLKETYPDAKLYVLDFTHITGTEEKYATRQIGGNVCTDKSYQNTELSSNSQWAGAWVSFDFAPDIGDRTGTFNDVFWVEFNSDTNVPVYYPSYVWYKVNNNADSFGLTDNPQIKQLGNMIGFTLTPTEGLTVTSSAKQKQEVDSWYRTYDGSEESILGLYSDAKFRLTFANESSLPATGMSVYWPVPKAGQNWGEVLCPEGAFSYSINLANALQNVPEGYEVFYARNAAPNGQFDKWDNMNWISQADASGWSAADWREVNFVKLIWVGTDTSDTINRGEDKEAVFDLTVDSLSTTAAQMYTLDVWQPYFLREYTNSSSWQAGKPTACILTPGHLGGTVWDDADYDGAIDSGETLLPGVRVELYDESTGSSVLRAVTETDSEGQYIFDGLKDGTAESGKADSCRIVACRPTAALNGVNYISFTKKGVDMSMTASSDRLTAFVLASPNRSDESDNIYNAGLIRSVSYTVPDVNSVLVTTNANYPLPDKYAGVTFTADISAADASNPMPGKTFVVCGKDSFGTLNFTEEGSYVYTVAQRSTVPAAYSAIKDTIYYDETEYTLTVTVAYDETEGSWSASGVITKSGARSAPETFDFVNELPYAEQTIKAAKTLTGRDLADEEFSFALDAANDAAKNDAVHYIPATDNAGITTYTPAAAEKLTARNDARGTVIFDTITYFEPGEYNYTIKEEATDKGGVTIDSNVYSITVTVSVDSDDKLVAAVSGDSTTGTDFRFENTYEAAPVDVNLSGVKTLEGRDLEADEFSFTLADGDTVIETVKNAADGSITFSTLTFDTVGEYTYTVKEEETDAAGIIFDDTVYTITVTVSDNENGELVAQISGDSATGSDLDFVNTCKTGSLTITKTVKGDLGDKDKKFTFTVVFDVDGVYPYTGSSTGTISSGESVMLKHGESITITGIPEGTKYTVTESDNKGYKVTKTGDEGTISSENTQVAKFTNFKSKIPATGDDSNVMMMLGVMFASLTGALSILFYGIKKRRYSRH